MGKRYVDGPPMREALPFILYTGTGTRLWPLSGEAFPKQFHKIVGPETLFRQTCRGLQGNLSTPSQNETDLVGIRSRGAVSCKWPGTSAVGQQLLPPKVLQSQLRGALA